MFKLYWSEKVENGRKFWVDIHGGLYWMIIRDGKPAESSLNVGGLVYNQMFEFLKNDGRA